jgi:hypothetical protein
MKTFIVCDLDSRMPVAVGEQVSAETARVLCTRGNWNFTDKSFGRRN